AGARRRSTASAPRARRPPRARAEAGPTRARTCPSSASGASTHGSRLGRSRSRPALGQGHRPLLAQAGRLALEEARRPRSPLALPPRALDLADGLDVAVRAALDPEPPAVASGLSGRLPRDVE